MEEINRIQTYGEVDCERQEREITKLKQRCEFWRLKNNESIEQWNNASIENKKLKEELKRERECVDWYADEQNQIAPVYQPTGKPGADFTQPYRMDSGKRARGVRAKRKADL